MFTVEVARIGCEPETVVLDRKRGNTIETTSSLSRVPGIEKKKKNWSKLSHNKASFFSPAPHSYGDQQLCPRHYSEVCHCP